MIMRGRISIFSFLVFASSCLGEREILKNGFFNLDAPEQGSLAYWSVNGDAGISQRITLDYDCVGPYVLLACDEFSNSTQASHAMICQTGVVDIQSGKQYRL